MYIFEMKMYTGTIMSVNLLKKQKISVVTTEILESELDEDNKQVAVMVADDIAKTLSERSECFKC